MKKTVLYLLVTLSGFAACQPKETSVEDDSGTPTPTPDGGGGHVDVHPDSGTANLPKPVLCPEANPFSPKNPNSVVVSETVLSADTTWTADKVYLVGDDFKVRGHKLTVEAGTTICLYQKGKIIVGEGVDPGEIHLNGTAEKPIVVTAPPSASDPSKPDVFHRGIKLDTYLGSNVSHVNIWFSGPGGGSGSWAFELTDTARGTPDPKKPLLVDHVTVGAVQSRGIRIGTELGIADGSKLRFTGFADGLAASPAPDAVAEVEIAATKSFAKAFDYAGAPIPDAAKHLNLRVASSEGKISANTELVGVGLPYLYANKSVLQVQGPQNDPVGVTLTIREGVTLMLDGAIVVGATSGTAQGNLVVAGTKEKPVTFTSTKAQPASGDWEGFYFVGGQFDPAKTKIEHAKVLYAGVDGSNGQQVNRHVGRCGANFVGAMMIANGALTGYDGPQLANVHVAHSKSHGIVSDANTTGGHLKTSYAKPDVTFEDIAGKALDNNGTCN